jgi:hypothetical protein
MVSELAVVASVALGTVHVAMSQSQAVSALHIRLAVSSTMQVALTLVAAARLNLLSESTLVCIILIDLELMGTLSKMDSILPTHLARLRAHPGDMACRATKIAAISLLNRSGRGYLSDHWVDIRGRNSLMTIALDIHDDFSWLHIRTLIHIS